jgi:hypothetical protein
MSFAVLTRPFALYLFLPIIAISWATEGKDMLKNPKNYLFAFSVLLTLSWYVWMASLGKGQDLAYDPYIFSRGDMAEHHNYLRLFAPAKLVYPAKILAIHLLTPLGALLALRGFLASTRSWKERIIYPWSAGVAIYLLFTWPTAISHSYYFLPLLPVFAFWVGKGVEALVQNEKISKIVKNPIVLGSALVLSVISVGYFYRLLYFVPEERRAIVRAGKAVQEKTSKSDLVIASWGSSPIQLYYSNRKGWSFNLDRADGPKLIEELEERRAEDASWFVTSTPGRLKELPLFDAHLKSRYQVVSSTPDFILYDLRTAPSP